ncbi:MAG: hypothetical protein NC089_03535 [Bacteroides sp.]|nr:hypothetical protein [Bacteroides sp.]MCM1549760.1 hypothetical protein [Clostridium sp.]
MSKKRKLLLNGIPGLVLAACFPIGGNIFPILIAALPILVILNWKFSDNVKKLLKYNGILLASVLLGILLNSLLYFWVIQYDGEGVMVMEAELIIALVYSLLVMGVAVWLKHLTTRRRKGRKKS